MDFRWIMMDNLISFSMVFVFLLGNHDKHILSHNLSHFLCLSVYPRINHVYPMILRERAYEF